MPLREAWNNIKSWSSAPVEKQGNYTQRREHDYEGSKIEKTRTPGKAAIGVMARFSDPLVQKFMNKAEAVDWEKVESWGVNPEEIIDFYEKSKAKLEAEGMGFWSIRPAAFVASSKIVVGTLAILAEKTYDRYAAMNKPENPQIP
ncbi:MAG: hypothetical protein ACT4OY_07555 [Alphaproteobacteria bacterium]